MIRKRMESRREKERERRRRRRSKRRDGRLILKRIKRDGGGITRLDWNNEQRGVSEFSRESSINRHNIATCTPLADQNINYSMASTKRILISSSSFAAHYLSFSFLFSSFFFFFFFFRYDWHNCLTNEADLSFIEELPVIKYMCFVWLEDSFHHVFPRDIIRKELTGLSRIMRSCDRTSEKLEWLRGNEIDIEF